MPLHTELIRWHLGRSEVKKECIKRPTVQNEREKGRKSETVTEKWSVYPQTGQ